VLQHWQAAPRDHLEVPMPARVSTATAPTTGCMVERVDVLGSLIHEYRHAA
jgi:hypothetical protein